MQEPYKGLRPYEEQDRDNFFGREAEKQILVDKILANKLTLLFAASGVGKSSLLQAAVIPQLRCVEGKTLEVFYYKSWFAHPAADLKHALHQALQQGQKLQTYEGLDENLSLVDFLSDCTLFTSTPFILVLDQFEEFFTSRHNTAHRDEFIEQLAEAILDRETETIFVIAMREDFAMNMEVFRKMIPNIFDNFYRLRKLSLEQARHAIVAPLVPFGFHYEPALLEELLQNLGLREQEERGAESVALPQHHVLLVEPPHLQIICKQLWEAERGNAQRTITQALYHQRGRAKGLLNHYFRACMVQFSASEKRKVSRTFDILVSRYGTKSARPLNELAQVVEVSEAELVPVLEKLDQARILRLQTRHNELWYELYHDVFAEHVTSWNEAYKNQQRWRKVGGWTGTGLVLGVLVVFGYDTWMNAINHHFRLSVKASVSDTIEVWQGKKDSRDWLGQQIFHYETDYERGDLEADKLFVQRSIEELGYLHQELIGSFPLANRLLAYQEDGRAYRDQTGKLGAALCLATASISPYSREVSVKMIGELGNLRSVAGFNLLLEDLVIQAPNDDLRQAAQNTLETVYAPPSVWKPWWQGKDEKVRNLAGIALGKLGYHEVIPQLIVLLKDSDRQIQKSALEVLSALGGREALPQITALLKDSFWFVCQKAIGALSALGGREALPQITDLLKDSSGFVRQKAIGALSALGGWEALPQITALLKDSDSEVRQSAIGALSALGGREALPQITALLKDSDPNVRQSAIGALSALGGRETLPQITDLLKDSDSDVRQRAIEVLSELGGRETLPQITDLLKDSDSDVRRSAIEVLSELGVREALPQITDLLKDSDSDVRQSAIGALSALGVREALPQITDLLKDSDSDVRQSAIGALSALGGRETLPQITDLLKNSDSEVRQRAIEVLSELGVREALPQITDLLKDSDSDVRQRAIGALSKLGGREALPQITALLKDSFGFVRQKAIGALSELGGREALPQITALLKDSDSEVRQSAIDALSKLGVREALPQITDLLKDSDSDVHQSAIGALSALGVREALPQITDLLKDSDWQVYRRSETISSYSIFRNSTGVRQRAIGALSALGGREALPQITALLKDSEPEVRQSAIDALSELGGREALPQITDLLKDSEPEVRQSAAKALGNFHQQQALPHDILKKITDSLQSQNLYARSGAAEALSHVYRYHPPALKDVPYNTLVTLLQDTVFHIRQHAMQALQALGAQQALSALRPLLHDPNTSVRWATVGALIALKEPNALEHLMSLLESFKVEPDVLTTLARQEEAWQDFLTRLHTQTLNVKMKVLTAVTDEVVAPLTPAGFDQFLTFLEEPDATVRWQTMRAVQRIFAGGRDFAFTPPIEKLKALLFNAQEDLDMRYRAFDTLGHLRMEKAAQIIFDFLQQEQKNHPDKPLFMLEGIHLLGNMRASVARAFLVEQLKWITREKQIWRKYRDQVTDSGPAPSIGNSCKSRNAPNQEQDKDRWAYEQWEIELGYALARIDVQEGLKNLSHPLAKVRKGTWTALGREPNAKLLQDLIDLRATAQGDTAPITHHAAFRAIDQQLMTLEFKGTVQDLAILKALKTTDPAILDRLEWTIGMLTYRCVERKWCEGG